MLRFAYAPGERTPREVRHSLLKRRRIAVLKGGDEGDLPFLESRISHQLDERTPARFRNRAVRRDRLDKHEQRFSRG